MAVEIASAVHASWPTRLLVVATGLTIGTQYTIHRVAAGVRKAVRGAYLVTIRDTVLVRTDAELPFGVPVYYVIRNTDTGTDLASSSPRTITLTGGKVAITDATTAEAVEVVIGAWPEKAKSRRASRHEVGGRTVVIAGQRGQFEGPIELLTHTDTQREALDDLLDSATEGILQIRQPGGYGGVDCYVSVLTDRERRFSQDGADQRRLWTIEATETESWSLGLPTRASTLEDIADDYDGKTLADIGIDFTGDALLDIAKVDWAAA